MMQRRAAGLVAALCAVVLVVDRFHSMSAPVSLLANQDGYASGAPYKTGANGQKVFDAPHVGGTNGVYMGANGGGNGWARKPSQSAQQTSQQLQSGRQSAGPGPPYPPPGPGWEGVPARQPSKQQRLFASVTRDLAQTNGLVRQGQGLTQNPRMRVTPGQKLAVGGVDIEGGQGNSDSIFGSHDDSSTFGVLGSGWQGPGNGVDPGELWNPAVGRFRLVPGQKLAVGGVDIEGGQGNSDSIFGSHDDSSTFGVLGSGWQGPGNGEDQGEMWNPAVGRFRLVPGQKLAVGGVDIEGGQGNSDSIFGSHDDSSTFGVLGSGWQGPGNGVDPGELWNPAVGRFRLVPGQKLAVGGVGIEGGQGESDSIFGSHDDSSTYGVLGSGWQGPGNGEAPGELWNSAVGRFRVFPGQKLAVGGVDIEGGQGNADSIFGSHDDSSTFGVLGSGWQGPGNGEDQGELWNPAVGQKGSPLHKQQLRLRQQQLAGPVPYPEPGPEWYETEWGKSRRSGQ